MLSQPGARTVCPYCIQVGSRGIASAVFITDGNMTGPDSVEAPAEKPEFARKIKITSYPAQEYAGLIFAYMGREHPPEFPKKVELDRSFGVKYSYSFIWPCNWFQRLENSIDATHVSFVHRRSTLGATVRSDIPDLNYEETEWGIRQTASRGPNNIRISEILFPNCNHIVSPDGPRPNENAWTDIFNVPFGDG